MITDTTLSIAFIVLIFILIVKVATRKAGEGTHSLKSTGPGMDVYIPNSSFGEEIHPGSGHFVDPNRIRNGVEQNGFIDVEETPPKCARNDCDGVGYPEKTNGFNIPEGMQPYKCNLCGILFVTPPPKLQAEQRKDN